MSSEPTPDQVAALTELVVELNAASELTLGKRLVPGREAGFYATLAETGEGRPLGPGGLPIGSKGGKRRRRRSLRGGVGACDSMFVRLAIDSAIILAGAAAIAGTGYLGIGALNSFMAAYSLDAASVAVTKALYESLTAALATTLEAAAGARAAAGPMTSSIASLAGTGFGAAATAAPSVLRSAAMLAPPMLFGRYFKTGLSAREDAMAILNGLYAQYDSLAQRTGAVTRSIAAKKDELMARIAETRAAVNDRYQSAVESGANASATTMASYADVRQRICDAIDRVASGAIGAVDALVGVDINEIIITGGKRRKSKKLQLKLKGGSRRRRKSTRRR